MAGKNSGADLDLQDLENLAGSGESPGGGRGKPRRGSRVLPLLLGVIILFFLGAVAWLKFGGSGRTIDQVNQAEVARKAQEVDNTETKTDSDVYRQANREEEFERAEAAEREGDSTIPRLMETEEIPVEEPAPPPPPAPEPVVPQPVAEPAPPPPVTYDGPRGQLDLSRWLAGGGYTPGALVVSKIESRRGAVQGQAANASAAGAADGENEAGPPQLEATPGEILYAIVEVGANSDQPGTPVVAKVASGRWAGAKFIGGFRRMDERLVLQFNRAVVTDRKTGKSVTYSVSGYAIDPETSRPGVASSVDTHFLARWGGLVASSFLEGLGLAKAQSGSKFYYGNDNNPAQIVNDYDPAEEAWIAAGKVGEKLSERFEDNFEMPPTVKLDPGEPIGILLL